MHNVGSISLVHATRSNSLLSRNGDLTNVRKQSRNTNLSITDQRFRYGIFPNTGQRELFGHQTDPLECKNIADLPESEEICNRLQRELKMHSFRVTHPVMGRIACW